MVRLAQLKHKVNTVKKNNNFFVKLFHSLETGKIGGIR